MAAVFHAQLGEPCLFGGASTSCESATLFIPGVTFSLGQLFGEDELAGRRTTMTEERNDVIVTESTTPAWVGFVAIVLVVISIAGLAMAWSATNHAKSLDQAINTQTQAYEQNAH